MRLSELDFKLKYDSDEDDILNSFYVPLLSHAERYDRSVGYFSSEVLGSVVEGLEVFIASGGKMRLVIGDPLSDEEYDAVMSGSLELSSERSIELADILLSGSSRGLKLLTYLVANRQLEIKFAFTHKGIFHKKIGIFYQDDEVVAFSGSANETLAGLSRYNSEEISVFCSWRTESFADYGQVEVSSFQLLWENKKKRSRVVSLDSDVYQKIRNSSNLEQLYQELIEPAASTFVREPLFQYSFAGSTQKTPQDDIDVARPRKPSQLKGRPFSLFSHQREAIHCWSAADYHGIFKLATGSGKTITAICAIVELYEARKNKGLPTFAIISVPYIELANQWVSEVSAFNIYPIKCYEGISTWTAPLDNALLLFRTGELDFSCIVVVNNTMSSRHFIKKLSAICTDNVVFVGDECHRLGSQVFFNALPQCRYRLGLSATPFRHEDEELLESSFVDEVKKNLLSYFTAIVSDYSLSDAISDGILTPYYYDLVLVYLNQEEQDVYEECSLKIQKMMLTAQSVGWTAESQQIFKNLCSERSRLLATCEEKLPALVRYIRDNPELSLSHSLVYVGEGSARDDDMPYINRVTQRLYDAGVRVSKFTSKEGACDRQKTMEAFKGQSIDALVAMKVLDEGIDVPACRNAFILASTRNPRQYVQRRGRVLRKLPGKASALIVDFVVLSRSNTRASQLLRKAELSRVQDFSSTSSNVKEISAKLKALRIVR